MIRRKRLEECKRKRKDAEKLEEEGKLPKRRKPGIALLQDEVHLMKQISEAERQVKKLEQHLKDMAEHIDEPEIVSDGLEEVVGWIGEQELEESSEERAGEEVGKEARMEMGEDMEEGPGEGAGASIAPAP
ncbi:hypothetical protein HOY80DRAFT_997923 [Tuber brumale]|nr:hypothetical protein HOY80DRAFT_997923 [Tuber brumale]